MEMKEVQKIIDSLGDELSKFIFTKRLEWTQEDKYNSICEMVERCMPGVSERQIFKKMIGEKKTVIFGGGRRAGRVVEMLLSEGVQVAHILDNNPNSWEKNIAGIEIVNPDEVDYRDIECGVITPADLSAIESISKQLINYGVKEEDIVVYRNLPLISEEDRMYFDEDFIKFVDNEVFIDAGVLNLNTSYSFIKYFNESGHNNYKVYAFEPDADSYKKCVEILENNKDDNIVLYNQGLWSKKDTLAFAMNGSASRIAEDSTNYIEVISLDEAVDDKVTFIKMDIEGAELEALKGSCEIIKKYKPTLAISIYHEKEDILDIPLYIKELVPEYKFYIRHYTNWSFETVLYAVIE